MPVALKVGIIMLIMCCRFKAPVRIGVIFKHLRKLMDSLLEKKLENPKMNLEGDVLVTCTDPYYSI